MYKTRLILPVTFLVLLAANVFTQTNTPASTAKSFYKSRISHSQTFDRRSVERLKPWLTDSFYRLFVKQLRLQNEFLKLHPDEKPYFGDGLSFMPLDETCETGGRSYRRNYSVGTTSMLHGVATVIVRFYYPKPCSEPSIDYKAKLLRTGSVWKLNDLIFDDGKSFAADLKAFRY